MNQNKLFAILNILFGIAFVVLSFVLVDKPLCGGGTMPFIFPLIFGIGGLINIAIGVYRLAHE